MGDLNKKIKDSKSVIEQSGLNNPNELYNKALNCKKEKVFKFRYSILLKYAFILLFQYKFQPDEIIQILDDFCVEYNPKDQEEYIRAR